MRGGTVCREVIMRASRLIAVVVLLFPLAMVATSAVAATEEERNFLAMYFTDDELEVLSATRSLKSVASVAENVAVVTAEDIEIMNAHTVAEALYNVTGIDLVDFKGPGSGGTASIHGSGRDRVTVMLDGVALNTANNDFQLATLPVQMVRKIEIIKGPASSTWGSSFGGVINVITKSVENGNRVDGTLSASLGGHDTSDLRAEVSARKGRFGIYLYGGRMDSDGLVDDHEFTHDNFYGKVNFDAGRRTRVNVSFFYHNSDSVNADLSVFGPDAYNGFAMETLYGKADLQTSLSDAVELRLSAWRLRNDDNFWMKQLSTGDTIRDAPIRYDRYGFSGSLAWRTQSQVLVAGADSSNGKYEEEFEPYNSVDQQEYALFVNDTISAGDLSVTPGVRYDHSSLAGGLASPSLGATYLASSDLLFRGLVSRGFNDPAIAKYSDAPAFGYQAPQELKPEKIWSYQAGVEANVADLLRAKLTLFYHDIDDILVEKSDVPGTLTTENGGSARTAGGEFEIATNSFKGFIFKSGVSYEKTKKVDYSEPQYSDVRDTYGIDATLEYHGKSGLRGKALAHYGWWDMTEFWQAESKGVVVDLSIAKKFLDTGKVGLDLFGAAHNIFNALSYNDQLQQNPERWLEAGVRCTF
jgi:vitamin B12 transporter